MAPAGVICALVSMSAHIGVSAAGTATTCFYRSPMNLGERIRSGTKWLFAGNIGNRFLQFAFGVALARLLVPADFGMIVTVQIFTGVAGFLAGGGMGQALVQAKEVEPRDYQIVFTVQLFICLLIYGLFFAIAPWFADWFDQPLYVDLLRVSALSFLLRPFGNIPNSMLHREMNYKAKAAINFATMLVTGIISVSMALSGFGVWSLILGGLAGSVISILMLVFVTKWHPGFDFDSRVVKRLGSYGIKVSANDIVSYISKQVSNFIISRSLGPSAVGLFNKAYSLQMLPFQVIGTSAYQTVFRALAKIQDNEDQSKYIYFRTITLTAVYTWPIFVGLLWIAEPFIVTVYGEKWVEAAAPLQVLAIGGFFLTMAQQSGTITAAQNLLGKELRVHIEYTVLLVVACIIGIKWGIIGVAWSTIPCYIYTTVRMVALASKAVGGTFSDLLSALQPAIKLNAILVITLLTAHTAIFERLENDFTSAYLLGMSVCGAIVYAVCFLFLPIKELRTEAMRWRKLFRIGAASDA